MTEYLEDENPCDAAHDKAEKTKQGRLSAYTCDGEVGPIPYSMGRDRYDNCPLQCIAKDAAGFITTITKVSGRSQKKGGKYICSPMHEGKHTDQTKYPGQGSYRQKHLAAPRRYAAFDIDGCTPGAQKQLKERLLGVEGCIYETASYTEENPHLRVVIIQNRATTPEESQKLSLSVEAILVDGIDAESVKFDKSVYSHHQPIYLPLRNARVEVLEGKPLDVDAVLATYKPETNPEPRILDGAKPMDPLLDLLRSRGDVRTQLAGGKAGIVCPFASGHSCDTSPTSTVYYLAKLAGVGHIHCLHESCAQREQGEYHQALGFDPHEHETHVQTIARLAALSPLDYDQIRQEEAQRLGVRVSTLDEEVERAKGARIDGNSGLWNDPPAYDTPVDTGELLASLLRIIQQHVVCDPLVALAAVLWIMQAWITDYLQIAPLAIITAPEKRCGKSTLLATMRRLLPRAIPASNISSPALFRFVQSHSPVLILDEVDAWLGDNEELRGLINAGHTRETAFVVRCVGDNHEPTVFNVFGPKVLCGIGNLPSTIMDRGVVLSLRRKRQGERVEKPGQTGNL